jgi:D-glycero-D-manno-heptose 1,7-bisphosphate phosphatase
VLFDRDETIVVDVPFNGDPEKVEPAPNARVLLDRLRAAGLPLAVVSNQSGVGRGLITSEQVDAVNRKIDELLGPFAGFFVCPHAPNDACECRKPKPKLILDAARALGVDPTGCVVVGDRESDVEAARNAGAIPLRVDGPHGLEEAVRVILESLSP